jgi:hypothetical protein
VIGPDRICSHHGPRPRAASRLFPSLAVCTTTTGAPREVRTGKVANTAFRECLVEPRKPRRNTSGDQRA